MNDIKDSIYDLKEIKERMKGDLEKAMRIIRRSGNKSVLDRSSAYWYAQIAMAIDDTHPYMGSSMYTFDSAISELDTFGEDDEEAEGVAP